METKEPDSRLSVRKEDLDDQELYRLNQVINDLYSKITTARDETDAASKKFTRSGVISAAGDKSTNPPPPQPEGGIPQPAASDWTLNPVVYSAGEDGLQYGFASASISSKPPSVDYYTMFIQDYASGFVDTNGTAVTLTSASKEAGNTFENCVAGQEMNINSVTYVISANPSAPFESLVLTTSAGVQSNVAFNLNPIDGAWEEIAADAEAGTWQLRPPTGWNVPCCLTASTKEQRTAKPPDGVNYKRLIFGPWADAPQVTNFFVSVEKQAQSDIPSGRYIVNFDKPLDPEYYYSSIERLWYVSNTFTGNIGATAIVDVSGNTATYNSTSSIYSDTFRGQYFTHVQPGDTVYISAGPNLPESSAYIVSEVISNTQLKLTTNPPAGTEQVFAQWTRIAGEINPFTQVDYWPLPTNAEYWKFRCRSVNHREIANNTTPPTVNVTVPASGGITPLNPSTQPGSSAWLLNALQYSIDEAGNSSIFVSATITTPAPDADYYSLFWQRMSTPVSGAWIEIAADAVAGTWQEWPSAGATYVVAIAANKNTYRLDQPDETIPSYYKTLTIPAWGLADQVTNFSVQVETSNRAGVPSGRFAFNFTKPADPDYYFARISRIATDSGYNPITANATALTSAQNGAMFEITSVGTTNFTAIGASANTVGVIFMKTGGTGTGNGTVKTAYAVVAETVDPSSQADWWPLPGSAEYWIFKSESVNYRKVVNTTTPPTSNISVTSSGGITQIAPATITTAAFASTIRPVEIVNSLPSLPSSSYPEGAVVFLTTDDKLYRSTGSIWTVATDGDDIVANSITGGKIAAGAISTTELFAGEILVGQGGGKPTRFTVVDSSSNVIGFIGDITSPVSFVGGYFKNLLIAPSISTTATPRLYATSAGLLELVGMNIEATNTATSGFDSGTVSIKPGNLYGAVQVSSSSISSLSAMGPNYFTTRSDNPSDWYPYCEVYRTSSAAIVRGFADPLLNTFFQIWADRNTPANNAADFKGIPIKINNVTAIDTSRGGSFANLTATGTITFPTGASNGYIWTSDASGVGSWQAVSSVGAITSINSQTGPSITIAASTGISIASATNTITITNSGVTSLTGTTNQVNVSASTGSVTLSLPQDIATTSSPTFTAVTTGTVGPTTSAPLNLRTDNTTRWTIGSTGMLIPAASDTYDIGILSSNRVRSVYAKFIDTAQVGSVGDYVKSRLIRIVDLAGGAGYWDTFANASTIGASNFTIKDNAGSRLIVGWRASGGSAVNYTFCYSDFIPALRSVSGGDAVTDTVYPSLGSTTQRWEKAWFKDFDFSGAGTITGNVLLNGSTNTMSGALRPGFDGLGSIGGISLRYGNMYTYGMDIGGALTAGGSAGSSNQLLASTGTSIQWQNISSRLSAGTGISITGTTTATIAIGQAVGTGNSVTFANVTSSGFFNGSSTTSYFDTSYNSSGAPYRLRGASLIDNGGVWISNGGINMNAGCGATSFNIFGGATGKSGTFTTADSKTVTVTNGIITSIV